TIKHIIKGEKPPVGTKVHGIIDWEKRYQHMKMHTAQHIISGIVFDATMHEPWEIKYMQNTQEWISIPIRFSERDLENIENKSNNIIKQNLPIKIYEEERDSLEKRVDQQRCNLDLLPKFIKKLRIIEIEGFDICPCAGTHVKNTSELSMMKIIKKRKQRRK
ncbi:putative metal-dependent hydrolase related to alanyl-tRNA synthetase HxxxH domain, partial [Thermoplasmatales archaeon SCGC AB-540-F20]